MDSPSLRKLTHLTFHSSDRAAMSLYPLKFVPIYKEKVWGGRTLEKLDRELPGDTQTRIGESWELADLATTSASGGGGDAARSEVANGPLAGQTINQLVEQYGRDLLGDLALSASGGLPILLKYLDASDNLSVQVHPSPDYAASHPDAHLKSEAWYIVAREPGAKIYKGMTEGTTAEQLRAALEVNTNDAVVPLMVEVPVEPGDCHYLPSGTCHALGGGILVAEVQTPSDTTFRVYDWGREGRELHVDQAVACIHFGPAESEAFERQTRRQGDQHVWTRLVACDYFTIDRIEAQTGFQDTLDQAQPTVWMVLEGNITAGGESFVAGDTVWIPPALNATLSVESSATWLEVGFPQKQTTTMA